MSRGWPGVQEVGQLHVSVAEPEPVALGDLELELGSKQRGELGVANESVASGDPRFSASFRVLQPRAVEFLFFE